MTLTIKCPAKVNTFLSVGPPDVSGYHPLRTVFQSVGLYDTLTISDEAIQTSVECDWEDLPVDNTLTKTLRLLRELVDLPPLAIHLQKQIPAQSGLGGGSSNAAGLLRALPRLLGTELPWEETNQVAGAVGADVPFFLVGGRAIGEGYGEKLCPLPDLPRKWLLVVRPEVGVSTAEAYKCLDSMSREWHPLPDPIADGYNDFERVAPQACVDAISRLRDAGATIAMLCGSGSASFGVFPHEAAAKEAQSNFGTKATWVVPTLTREESLWMS